jgi:membrane associated rhomboid family serine protease
VRLSPRKPSIFARPWRESRRVALFALIALNVASFVAQFSLDALQPGFVSDYLGLSKVGVYDAYSWQFLSAAFLHSSPWHFLGNILLLCVLGRDLESILGQRHFVYLYLAGAFSGELGHLFLMPPQTVLFGASGAVAALVMAYATILPELNLIEWRSRWFQFQLKAKHAAVAMFLLALVMFAIDRTCAVMYSAIPGGFAAGWLYANLLGFGHASWLRRFLRRRREAARRVERMSREEFIEQELDPLLEKIARTGMQSLTRAERRILECAREKVR